MKPLLTLSADEIKSGNAIPILSNGEMILGGIAKLNSGSTAFDAGTEINIYDINDVLLWKCKLTITSSDSPSAPFIVQQYESVAPLHRAVYVKINSTPTVGNGTIELFLGGRPGRNPKHPI